METNSTQTNWLAWVLGGLSLVLLVGGIYYWNQTQDLNQLNDRTEQRADSLMSVGLQLGSDMRKLNDQLATAEEDNTELNKQIVEANRRLNQNNASFIELKRSNARRYLTVQQQNRKLSRDLLSLNTERDSMNNQMSAMQNKIGWMTDTNAALSGRNDALGKQVVLLNATMQTMVPRAILTADNFRIEAVKANKKETAKAKKVNRLTISMNVPEEMGLTGRQDVFLSLTDEQRKAIIPPMRSETINLTTSNEVIPVHAVQSLDFGPGARRVSFQLDPDVTLKPGVYRAAVYTKDAYLGSVEFRFRDSFWFF